VDAGMDFQLPYHTYLKRNSTKYSALYHALREEITRGRLPFAVKLPSSRELAAGYQISRGTVNQVYEMLLAEGYLSAEVGRGTYVLYKGDAESLKPALDSKVVLSNGEQPSSICCRKKRRNGIRDCPRRLE
jgi:GntR family transcriptional regulator/MocR family aminotransferase